MKFDLHIHSTASDGEWTPEQTVQAAHGLGIKIMALSDHDTAAGVKQAQAAAVELGMWVIPAIELSAAFAGELHILGYGINIDHPSFIEFSRQQQLRRRDRNKRMIQALQKASLNISEQACRQIAAGADGNWGRSHMARVLVKNGHCASTQEAFARYLGYGTLGHVQREQFSASECLNVIHTCGGYGVLAHPGLIELPDHQLIGLIRGLKDNGLDGVEAFYPQHSPRQASFFVRQAKMLELDVTYGSDFHGPSRPGNAMLAGWEVHRPLEVVMPFIDMLRKDIDTYAGLFGS